MKTKLCIFDLDGTLLDTIDDIGNSMNHVIGANGYPPRSISWYKDNVGYGAKNLLEGALPADHGLSGERSTMLLTAFKEHYLRHSMDLTKPYEGITELLKHLEGNGVDIAVVSNKSDDVTKALIETFFGDISFVAVYGERSGIPGKPDPSLALDILSQTGLSPEQVIIIGDAETDVLFARNASIFSIGVTWGFRSRAVLIDCGADAIVDAPEQITEFL